VRAAAVQPGEGKAVGRPYCGLSVPEGACKKAGENLFSMACHSLPGQTMDENCLLC